MFLSLQASLARIGRWPRLLAATACLLLAAVSAVEGSRHRAEARPAAVPTAGVVVAARDLPVGRVLHATDLRLAPWPAALGPPGAAHRVRARVGARLAGPLRAGEPVTTTRLVGASLTDGLEPGLVAVSVRLPDAHLSDLVHPGDRVELLATPRDDLTLDTGSPPPAEVAVLADHAPVLAVLPGNTDDPGALVIAADRGTTLRIARAEATRSFTAVPVSP